MVGGATGWHSANLLVSKIYELPKCVAIRVEKKLSDKSKYNLVVNHFAKTIANKTESVLRNTLERVDCKEIKTHITTQTSSIHLFQIKKRVKLKIADVISHKTSKMIDEKLNLISTQRYWPKCGKKRLFKQANLFFKERVLPILAEEISHIKLDRKA